VCKLSANNATLEQDKYILQNNDGTLLIKSLNYESSIDSNWISEKSIANSISVYRNSLTDPHFFTFQTTEDKTLQGTYQHTTSNGIRGHSRSAYFIDPSEISTTSTELKFWMLFMFFIVFGFLCALGIFAGVMNFGSAFAFFFVLSFSCMTAWVQFVDLTYFLVMLISVFIVSLGVGLVNYMWGKSIGSIISCFLLMAYFFFGGSPEHRYVFGPVLAIYALLSAFFTWKLERITASQKIKFFALMTVYWMCMFQFWSYIWNIYPTELYFRSFKGPLDYHVGTQGSGIRLYIPSIFAFFGVGLCLFLSGLLADRRSRLGNYGVDPYEKDSMPLI